MSSWNPTHVQFTVLRARNLIAKGKGGNNDVFVTIQLGKEKYQTSTIKNALHPEWFEECDLPIPYIQAEIDVCLYHRGVLSDDFLGYSAIPLWAHNISDCTKSQWVQLRNKPTSKSDDSKYRGELEVKLTFHCESRPENNPHGLKKRPNSIRNFAQAFGDKLKFSRSRSFRENRKDPEGGKVDKGQTTGGNGTVNGVGLGWDRESLARRPLPRAVQPKPVHFSALDVSRAAPWMLDEELPDNLQRSYSLSAAYIKSVSQERAELKNNDHDPNGYKRATFKTMPSTDKSQAPNPNHGGVAHVVHSQSMYNLPGNRRSYVDTLPSHSSGFNLPYDTYAGLSKDDTVLYATPGHRRGIPDQHAIPQSSSFPAPQAPSGLDILSRRDPRGGAGGAAGGGGGGGAGGAGGGGGIYESIKERTEPENSGNSSTDQEIKPKPRSKRYTRREVPLMGNSSRDYGKGVSSRNVIPIPPFLKDSLTSSTGHRDSGIVEDRSSSQANSRDGSIATQDGGVIFPGDRISSTPGMDHLPPPPQGNNGDPGRDGVHPGATPATISGVGHRQFHTLPSQGQGSKDGRKNMLPAASQFYSRENSLGELVVRKRSRGERDRLRQLRQGSRRFTVQGLDHHQTGLYDDSLSDPSDSSRSEVPEDLLSVYKNMNKEELLRIVIQTKAQMIRKDQYIKDLEKYIDDLLVRVMETTPRLLSRVGLHRL